MKKTIGYSAKNSASELRPFEVERRDPLSNDVEIDIRYCGVCHSDVHQARNEWKNTVYPCMPGHEIVGTVASVGSRVTKFKVGDTVGVGCMVDSCRECTSCRAGLENYCERGFLGTYNGNLRTPTKENLTYGGYSERIVVREDFVLRMPSNLDLAGAAPLLCAGVTTYSPLRHWNAGPGKNVGIVGLGGLGQVATKIARAMGATVTVITTTEEKQSIALKLGAAAAILSSDKAQMDKAARTLDVILSTIPEAHDPNPFLPLLRRDGVYVVVGCLVPLEVPLDCSAMNPDRRSVGTTLIGSIAETQEMLEFCGKHNIVSEIQTIPIDQINDAFAQVDKGRVAFRYVLDMATLKGKQEDAAKLA
jgi:alcohol dehydrogenase (NADP+)